MKFGVQLYGLDDQIKENPVEWFEALSANGYTLIEPCIRFGAVTKGWEVKEFADYVRRARAAGLEIVSCHILSENAEADTGQVMELLYELGVKYLVWNIPKIENEQEGSRFAETCISSADQLMKYGIELLLHNGADAVSDKLEGLSVFEWLLRKGEGKIHAEPDVGWIYRGGLDPEEFLWKNKAYIRLLHYKDFDTADGRECVIGGGEVDLEGCFQFARANEIISFIDQDESQRGMEQDIVRAAESLRRLSQCRSNTESILCLLDVESGKLEKLRTFDRIIEAPNWLRDRDTILYNSEGSIWKYSISKDREERIDTGFCNACNNDHVISPDERFLAVSHNENNTEFSRIYKVPIEGGEPELITKDGPSYLHGWSPDGDEIAYCAFRRKEGAVSADVYTKPVYGGAERQITEQAGFNDGPEYSPDGRNIWFISTRTGLMQVWKMDRDGKNQKQMTFEPRNNWFGHISPDGQKVVNLSYSAEGLDADEHLPNMNVELWYMNSDGGDRRRLLQFFGGQGSINVNSWGADSRQVALVIYKLNHK